MLTAQLLSRVRLFATPWTVAPQAPLSWDSPGRNTGVGCRALLQGIFLTQGSHPCLLHYRQILYLSVTREALNQLYNLENHNNNSELFSCSLWVSCLPQAGGEALPLSWCLALRLEDAEMPSPHVWPAVMAASRGPAGRLAGHARTGSCGLHTAAGSACEHVKRWKTPGSDDPASEVVQCDPCCFLLVRDLLVQTRLRRAYSRAIVSLAAQGRPQTANCPPVTAPPSSGSSSGAWPPPSSGSSSGAWPPPQLRFFLGEGAQPQFGFILGVGGSAFV